MRVSLSEGMLCIYLVYFLSVWLILSYSLPPDEDEAEVARLLSVHLSRYATIHNVKVIHDNKGGVCAFVQCEVCAINSKTVYMLICFRSIRI